MIITFIIKYWNFKCRKSAITSHTDKYIYRYKQVFILKYLWRGKKQRRLRKKRRFQTGFGSELIRMWRVYTFGGCENTLLMRLFDMLVRPVHGSLWEDIHPDTADHSYHSSHLRKHLPCLENQQQPFWQPWRLVNIKMKHKKSKLLETRPTQICSRNYARTYRKLSIKAKLLLRYSRTWKDNTPPSAKLGLCRRTIYSKLSTSDHNLFQIFLRESKFFFEHQIFLTWPFCRGIKRKVGAGEIGI